MIYVIFFTLKLIYIYSGSPAYRKRITLKIDIMNAIRQRPRGTFISTAKWQELYILSKHWKSDLQFYKEDLRFLHRLINKYFIWLSKSENIEMVRRIEVNVNKIGRSCDEVIAKVDKHIKQFESIDAYPEDRADKLFRIVHEQLEDQISDFVKVFRENRKEVFKITEYVVDSEQLVSIFES